MTELISLTRDFKKQKVIKQDKWLCFVETKKKRKTIVIDVVSKCSLYILGQIRWHPAWRHYCFFPTIEEETVYSDRCLISISEFITELNLKHKEVKSGCDANDDGIPPNNKLLGILPTIL